MGVAHLCKGEFFEELLDLLLSRPTREAALPAARPREETMVSGYSYLLQEAFEQYRPGHGLRPPEKGGEPLKTAVVTDGKYRASLAAVPGAGRGGLSGGCDPDPGRGHCHAGPPLSPALPRRPGGFPAPAGRRTTAPACGSCWRPMTTLFSSVPGRTPSTWSAAGGRSWPGRRTFWWRRSRCWMP